MSVSTGTCIRPDAMVQYRKKWMGAMCLIIEGKCNRAQIFTESLDEATEEQIRTLCDLDYLAQSKIRVMPDVHAGVGCTIGTTMTLHGRVAPNMVGVDIGCGMTAIRLARRKANLDRLDAFIRENIPVGRAVRHKPHERAASLDLTALRCFAHINAARARASVGTLGGGNHFIELDRGEDEALYLVIHSGSRHLGVEVAEYYQKEGYQRLDADAQKSLSKALAYVEGDLFDDYLHDMGLVQRFAALNRRAMAEDILDGLNWEEDERFETIHNYIDLDAMILRKGAVSAKEGERLLIPINMRDGSLLCEGLGNEEWNCSAPHGAGRLMSRTEAQNRVTLKAFKDSMKGIYTTCVSKDTLDESPMAYKPMEDILRFVQPTVRVTQRLLPIYNFKAGE